jgi:hypothetical protein
MPEHRSGFNYIAKIQSVANGFEIEINCHSYHLSSHFMSNSPMCT